MPSESELGRVVAECVLQEKIEAGEVRLSIVKRCAFCDEKISANARICPHCQSVLDESLLPKPSLSAHIVGGGAMIAVDTILFFFGALAIALVLIAIFGN
jgi:hypothetical protein